MHQELSKAHNQSGPAMSLANRWKDVDEFCLSGPEQLSEFASLCQQLYHPLGAAKLLGYRRHPDLSDVVAVIDCQIGQREVLGSTAMWSKVCKNIVYHCDLHAQFMDLSHVVPKKPHNKPNTLETSVDDVLANEALALFRRQCKSDVYFSIQTGDVALDQAGGFRQMSIQYVDAEDGESDMDFDDGLGDALNEAHLFFKVVCNMPQRLKLDECDGPSTKPGFQDVVVTVHKFLRAAEDKTVQVEARPLHRQGRVDAVMLKAYL